MNNLVTSIIAIGGLTLGSFAAGDGSLDPVGATIIAMICGGLLGRIAARADRNVRQAKPEPNIVHKLLTKQEDGTYKANPIDTNYEFAAKSHPNMTAKQGYHAGVGMACHYVYTVMQARQDPYPLIAALLDETVTYLTETEKLNQVEGSIEA